MILNGTITICSKKYPTMHKLTNLKSIPKSNIHGLIRDLFKSANDETNDFVFEHETITGTFFMKLNEIPRLSNDESFNKIVLHKLKE